LTAEIVASVFRRDHRIGSKAAQATALVRPPITVVAQPVRIGVGQE
jgi:hypothetical protein